MKRVLVSGTWLYKLASLSHPQYYTFKLWKTEIKILYMKVFMQVESLKEC
jgi:hypothetical protein